MNHLSPYRKAAQTTAVVLVILFGLWGCGSYRPNVHGPFNVYLTIPEDASHGMVINYHTLPPESDSGVQYDTVSHNGEPGKYASHAEGKPQAFTYVPDGRLIHCVKLQGLNPGATYYFIVGNEKSGYSKELKFRALPDKSEGLRFVNGGDMGTFDAARTLLKLAASKDPSFAIVGGDVSYATRDPKGAKEWDIWFKNWSELMVSPQGYTIPIITAIGNHEIKDKSPSPSFDDRSPFYWRFFGHQSAQPYFSRKIGDAAFIFLDAGNLVPHEGVQTEWLAAELAKYQSLPIKLAIYHQPLYPAYRDFDGGEAVAGRKLWLPLFDQYHLTAAFEHHDHVFKRSKILKNNAVAPEGTLYVGDGCFGQKPRSIDDKPRWYLEKSSSTAHFWLVILNDDEVQFQAINTDGKVFDECSQPVTVANIPKPAGTMPAPAPAPAPASAAPAAPVASDAPAAPAAPPAEPSAVKQPEPAAVK